ncbi:MAG: hypothetical protein HC820_02455 [Hydrococcus sp. RM1_1_31]|nr:hypothetical protein [Hydrococcus sp. RM1_1_31]
MTKPDYEHMTRKELKEHLLAHRNDEKAWAVFFEQLSHLDATQGYPPDLPTEEMEKIFKAKLNQTT